MVSRSNQTLVLGCPDLVVPHAFHTTCSSSWIHISTCVSACTPDPRLPVDHPPEHILRFAYAESPKRRKPQGNQASYEANTHETRIIKAIHYFPPRTSYPRLPVSDASIAKNPPPLIIVRPASRATDWQLSQLQDYAARFPNARLFSAANHASG